MRQTGKSKNCVWRWQERFATEGAERVVALTLADPPGETTHWTADMMAKAAGISASAVGRIWKAHGLAPHRWRQFKLSNDPKFIDKLRDVVGLYVNLLAGLRRGEIDFLISALRNPQPVEDVEQRQLFTGTLVLLTGRTIRYRGSIKLASRNSHLPWVVAQAARPFAIILTPCSPVSDSCPKSIGRIRVGHPRARIAEPDGASRLYFDAASGRRDGKGGSLPSSSRQDFPRVRRDPVLPKDRELIAMSSVN